MSSLPNWPACPDCETDVFVEGSHSRTNGFVCHCCDQRFDADDDDADTAGTS